MRKFEERRGLEVVNAAGRVSRQREKYLAEVRARHDRVIAELQARFDHRAGVPVREGGES